MRPPRVDPSTIEVEQAANGAIYDGNPWWVIIWDETLPDYEWLLTFWNERREPRNAIRLAPSADEAVAHFLAETVTAE